MKPALSDRILLQVEKPARYIGNEINIVRKDTADVDIRFVMCFPDVYEIGMSHLGMQILYEMFNRREDVYCERVFSPWMDMDKLMRANKIPLFALETQEPVRCFDFLGITIQYEMCYTNILQILDLSNIPLHACDRTGEDPLVIGGGPCTYNPEPLAEFFDMFYIGEGEVVYDRLLDLYKTFKASIKGNPKDNSARKDFLRAAASIPGIYVPSLYKESYNNDGTLASFEPLCEEIPAVIERQVLSDMDSSPYIEKPLVPFIKITQDRIVLEIMRGCIRGCRFCQAGCIYRPLREHSLEFLKEYAVKMLKVTGAEEISLSSLSSSDYSRLGELIEFLIEHTGKNRVNISLPSLRIDSFSLDVMKRIQNVKKSSLTFAPEAGTQRLRNVINKGISEEDILEGSMKAFLGGWNRVKLYFMVGLPTETEEDLCGIADLCEKIAENYYDIPKGERNGRLQVTASSSFFVPKPFTPFQWAVMLKENEYLERAYFIKDNVRTKLNQKSIKYTYHDAQVTLLEGLLARGDRRVSSVIEEAYHQGALYDSWSDCFDMTYWKKAMDKLNFDPEFYTCRERKTDELFPWDFIDIGVKKDFLKQEWERSGLGVTTPNCRQDCSLCGAIKYKGGVCFENKN